MDNAQDLKDAAPSNPPPGLSVVIPCYNEENGVAATLSALIEVLDNAGIHFEIIVVDDGSNDGTKTALEPFNSQIQVLQNTANLGYGASLKRGFRSARAPYICIIDADGSYPVTDVAKLFAQICDTRADMVVGVRTGDKVSVPIERKPAKWVLGKLANYVVGQKIPDMNSGLRVFSRELALRMIGILPDGFSLTTTITLAMLSNRYDVIYTPINYHRRIGRSKIRPIADTLNFLQLIAKMALYFAPLRVFIPLSFFLFLMGVGWGTISYLAFGHLADVSTLALVMTSVQTAAIGLLAELIRWRAPTIYEQR
jgi:glycosyltransferase involved in cell wall biosynthesis